MPKNVSKLPVWQFNVRLVDCYSESRVTATEDSLLFALMILVVLSQRIAEPFLNWHSSPLAAVFVFLRVVTDVIRFHLIDGNCFSLIPSGTGSDR
mgnify:CR=1 FL=1